MARILVIDDDPDVREMICCVLETSGHEALAFHNGRAAIERLQRDPADLLITDIFMPDIDGLETIRRIRRTRGEMPIIAISGVDYGRIDYLDIAEKFGAAATLKKPFRPRDLLELVKRALAAV
jgi:CheY-like chemotaxis protein